MHSFSQSSTLPFITSKLPDEIFGSWIGRLAIDNGIHLKSVFLKWLGVPKPLRRITLADLLQHSDTTFHVLSSLDLTYSECLTSLSTLPYWESVHVSSEINCKDSHSTEPDRSLSFRQGALNKSFKDRSESFLRICPACIYEDWHSHGASYFHRSHQLWGTRVCHIHGVLLFDKCRSCKAPLGDVHNLLTISRYCHCGANLTEFSSTRIHPEDVWWKLAVFEHKCLNSKPGSLEAIRVCSYLRDCLRNKFPDYGGVRAKRVLEQTFGEEGTNWLRRTFRKGNGSVKKVSSNLPLSESSVSIYAALFVACNLSFDEACTEIRAYRPKSDHEFKKPRLRNSRPITVDEARQRFKEYLASDLVEKRIRFARPFAYWLLAIEDFPWLMANLPTPPRNAADLVPSMESDREILYTCDPNLALQAKLPRKFQHAAIRAFYRDREWLESMMQTSSNIRRANSCEILRDQLNQLRAEHCSRSGRPSRFTRRDAARALNVSLKSLLSQTSVHGVPYSLLEEDLWTYRRRALDWAVKQRLAKGLSLAPSMVRTLAGISTSVDTEYIAKVIKDITKT